MRTRVASGTVSRAQAERCSGVRPQEALKELREIREETGADGGAELDVPQAPQEEDEEAAAPEEWEPQEPVGYDPDRPDSPWDGYRSVMEEHGYGYYY